MGLRAFVFISVVTFLSGCGQKKEVHYSDSPQVEVVTDPTLYPSVVLVVLPEGRGICTGTIISPKAVLTAAHCTKQTGRYTIMSNFGTHSTYDPVNLGPGVLDDPQDVSILVFSDDIAKRSLNQTAVVGSSGISGEKIRIVGFGCNDLSTRRGSGVKRSGTNHIHSVGDYIELRTPFMVGSTQSIRPILGPKDEAGSCFGDSGGPMFRSDSHENALVGVTHAGGDNGSEILSQYINLGRSDIQEFIHNVDSEYDLGIFDLCDPGDPLAGPPCSADSASMHIMDHVRLLLGKVWGWITSLFGGV